MSEQEQPTIDYGKLDYPSDALTLGSIRKALPDLFSQSDPTFFDDFMNAAHVSGMVSVERLLAHKAFAAALGRPDPNPDDDNREELIEMLGEDYQRFGLASGPQHTTQLIRTLEDAAAAQAREHLGPMQSGPN